MMPSQGSAISSVIDLSSGPFSAESNQFPEICCVPMAAPILEP